MVFSLAELVVSMQFCTLDQKISYLLQFIKLEELLFSMAVATLNRSRTLLLDGSTVVSISYPRFV